MRGLSLDIADNSAEVNDGSIRGQTDGGHSADWPALRDKIQIPPASILWVYSPNEAHYIRLLPPSSTASNSLKCLHNLLVVCVFVLINFFVQNTLFVSNGRVLGLCVCAPDLPVCSTQLAKCVCTGLNGQWPLVTALLATLWSSPSLPYLFAPL